MISRRSIVLTLAAATLAGRGLPAFAASAANPIKLFDTDKDGTLDLAEVKKAASALFAKLDRDGGMQWPVTDAASMGTRILHADGFVRGQGKFVLTRYVPTDEKAIMTVLSTSANWRAG